MTAMIRFWVTGIVLSAAFAGVVIARPTWLEVLGVEMASQEQPRSYTILGPGETGRVLVARCEAKGQIMDRLRTREMNLFEAAAWFRQISLQPAQHVERSWQYYEGNSQEEKLCRQVIVWATSYLAQLMPASELELLLVELEGQLADRLCAEGGVDLPSWQ